MTYDHDNNSVALSRLYNNIRHEKNVEYIRLRDDNTTLLRKVNFNRYKYYKRQGTNELLKLFIIFVCLQILVGYLFNLGLPIVFVIILTVMILLVFCYLFTVKIRQMQKIARPVKFEGVPKKAVLDMPISLKQKII